MNQRGIVENTEINGKINLQRFKNNRHCAVDDEVVADKIAVCGALGYEVVAD